MRSIALPFLVLPNEIVDFKGWMIGDPGQPLLPAEDTLEGWDYERDVEVCAEVAVDFLAAAEALGLPHEDLRLSAVLVVGTGAGTLPKRLERVATAFICHASPAASVSGVLPGHDLSGRILLELRILLDAPLDQGPVLSPKHKGSRLWQTRKDILIEDGGDSRFPVELVSFSDSFNGFPEQYAPWCIRWKPDALHADFGGSVRLYINSDEKIIAERFASGDSSTLQAILGDVMSQMISSLLDQEDPEEELSNCEDGSVGHQIHAWMDMAFPGQPLGSIRSLREQFPWRFRAAILAAANPGSGEE